MGQPSMAIYVNELFSEYAVQSVVRVGSCGALTERLAIRDVVIASGACTDSSMNRIAFEGLDYAPVADFGLLRGAVEAAERRGTAGSRRAAVLQRLLLRRTARAHPADGRLRRPRGRDGGQRALHARRQARSQGAGDLHGLRPRRHRRGDHGRRARADLRRHGRDRAHARLSETDQALERWPRGGQVRAARRAGRTARSRTPRGPAPAAPRRGRPRRGGRSPAAAGRPSRRGRSSSRRPGSRPGRPVVG